MVLMLLYVVASLQSIGSEESIHDSRTDEKKLEPPAKGDKVMPLYSNGNCAETTVDVASPPVKKPTSILRVSKANSKVTSPPPVPAVVSTGTETSINMKDLDEQPPVPRSSAKLEGKALQREASDDLQDCGILASMMASTSEEYFEQTKDAPIAAAMVDNDMDCSTLAAMVVSNSVVEEEVNMSGKASGESLKAVVIQDSPNKADRSVSPIAKKVSFLGMQLDAVPSRSGRPLPAIGADPTAISEPANWLSHKGLISSRQLPPLAHSGEEMLGSHTSLLSGSSQLPSQFGSANSLPVPDPRHSKGLLSRLSGALNASLDAAYRPAATGGKKKKDKKKKDAGKKPLRMPEHIREACPPPLPSPGY